MTERYCEGERFADLSFTEETFEDCDFTDCVFVDCSFTKCELDHTSLNECKFVRCEITGLRSTHSSVQSLDFEDCRLQEIEWAPLLSNGAFPDPIHTLKECSLKYNTFTEMNFNRFNFSDGNEIVGSMFAKCEMQLANFRDVELHETEFYQCDQRGGIPAGMGNRNHHRRVGSQRRADGYGCDRIGRKRFFLQKAGTGASGQLWTGLHALLGGALWEKSVLERQHAGDLEGAGG